MPLDIRTRAVLETLEFHLVDAADEPLVDDEGKPCMAVVHGPGSRRYAAAQSRKQSRMFAKIQKGKTLSETGAEQAEFLADITDRLDLDYADDATGQALTGREKFIAIYRDPSIGFIAEQVAKKANDWGNFSQGSKKP